MQHLFTADCRHGTGSQAPALPAQKWRDQRVGNRGHAGQRSSASRGALWDAGQIVVQACPGWVEAVEAGKLDGDEARTLVAQIHHAAFAAGADTLVSAAHYPFLHSADQRSGWR